MLTVFTTASRFILVSHFHQFLSVRIKCYVTFYHFPIYRKSIKCYVKVLCTSASKKEAAK